MPDDTVLSFEKYGVGDTGILILPAVGESVSHVRDLALMLARNATVYAVELRGHGLSEGEWSAERQLHDVEHLLSILKHKRIIVIAAGFSATLLLHREQHRPLGMVLINPLADGSMLRPGHCRVPSSRKHLFSQERKFTLSPALHAPAIIFTRDTARWLKLTPHASIRYWPELRVEQLHQILHALSLFQEQKFKPSARA